jgi:transposase
MAMDEAAKRRVRAGRLLQKGWSPAVVAARVGAPRQTVYRWRDVLVSGGGIDALRQMSKGGRPARLDAQQHEQLRAALLAGPQASGFGTELWTIKRVSQLVQRRFGVRYSDVHISRLLGQLGFSSQKPERQAKERDAAAVTRWRRRTWPELKKKPSASGG